VELEAKKIVQARDVVTEYLQPAAECVSGADHLLDMMRPTLARISGAIWSWEKPQWHPFRSRNSRAGSETALDLVRCG
jgi:hypothetical protein